MFGLMVQIITGHNYLRRQQHIIDVANKEEGEDPTCDLCNDGEQTSQHILGECGALASLRIKHFGTAYMLPPFTDLKKKDLVGFLQGTPLDALNFFLEK